MDWSKFLKAGGLASLLACTLLAACSKSSQPTPTEKPPEEAPSISPEKFEEKSPGNNPSFTFKGPTPPAQRPGRVEFVIYYDLEPIPDTFLKNWTEGASFSVTQKPLSTKIGNPPLDGDLYVVGPAWVLPLKARMAAGSADAAVSTTHISPVFKGYSFDPTGHFAIPWRWTPFVLLIHKKSDNPAPVPAGWEKNPGTVGWLDRPHLARAFWLKAHNLSANTPMTPALEQEWRNPSESFAAAAHPELARLWEELQAGNIPAAIVPAALLLRHDAADFQVEIPKPGTLIQLDHLVIREDSPNHEAATSLVKFLISPENENRLPEACGYLPVTRPIGEETAGVVPPLPKGNWFNSSEFVLTSPVEEVPRAVAVPTSTAAIEEISAASPTPAPVEEPANATTAPEAPASAPKPWEAVKP